MSDLKWVSFFFCGHRCSIEAYNFRLSTVKISNQTKVCYQRLSNFNWRIQFVKILLIICNRCSHTFRSTLVIYLLLCMVYSANFLSKFCFDLRSGRHYLTKSIVVNILLNARFFVFFVLQFYGKSLIIFKTTILDSLRHLRCFVCFWISIVLFRNSEANTVKSYLFMLFRQKHLKNNKERKREHN